MLVEGVVAEKCLYGQDGVRSVLETSSLTAGAGPCLNMHLEIVAVSFMFDELLNWVFVGRWLPMFVY